MARKKAADITDASLTNVTLSEAEAEAKAEAHQSPRKRGGDENGFSEWWGTYPKKIGRGTALEAWKKLSAEDRKLALEAVKVFAASWAGAPDETRQFLVGPAPWLNQKRWTDDPAEWRRMAFRDHPELLKQHQREAEKQQHDELMARIKRDAEARDKQP